MQIRRDTKFGYGFTLAGIGLPFLIEKLIGPLVAVIVAAVLTVLGFGFLLWGHFHKDEQVGFAQEERRPTWQVPLTIILLLAVSASLAMAIMRLRKVGEAHKPASGNTDTQAPSQLPPPIEVSAICRFETLPAFIPVGEDLRLVALTNGWPKKFSPMQIDHSPGPFPMQWPPRIAQLMSSNKADYEDLDCVISNHGKNDVLDLTIPFTYWFGLAWKDAKELDVKVPPLDAGQSIHVRFVDDCRDRVSVYFPKYAQARVVGEKDVRDFELGREPNMPGWGLNGVSFKGGWGSASCN